jgi:hypothetical protein
MQNLFDKAVAHTIMALPAKYTARLLKLRIVSDEAFDIFDELLDARRELYEARHLSKRLPGH